MELILLSGEYDTGKTSTLNILSTEIFKGSIVREYKNDTDYQFDYIDKKGREWCVLVSTSGDALGIVLNNIRKMKNEIEKRIKTKEYSGFIGISACRTRISSHKKISKEEGIKDFYVIPKVWEVGDYKDEDHYLMCNRFVARIVKELIEEITETK